MSSPENMWVKFFTDAGLPSGISATYSLTFTDNRIQMNMLLDLNKEYLREMGISCMGDVIAILRHAKRVHEETARDRVLSVAGPKVPVAAVVARPGLPKPPTPATRMLEHYTRNSNANTPSPPSSVTAVTTMKERLGSQLSGIKRKVINFSDSGSSKDSSDQDEISAPKQKKISVKKHVSGPVSEIKVPSEKKVSSVFARLGLSDETKSPWTVTTESKKNITITRTPVSSTVFSRLGDKKNDTSIRKDSIDNSERLEYAGILVREKVVLNRQSPVTAKTVIKKLRTMRADEEPINIKDKLPASLQNRKTVKFSPHIDYKEIEKRPIPKQEIKPPPIRNVRTVALTSKPPNKMVKKQMAAKHNIKTRLGKTKIISKNNNKSSVFNRLGVLSKA